MFLLCRYSAFCVGLGTGIIALTLNVMGRPVSLGLIFSVIYMILMSLRINNIMSVFKVYGYACCLPLLYTVVLAISNTLNASSAGFFFPDTFFLNWLLMMFLLIHSLDDCDAPLFTLYGLSFGASFLSVLFFIGVGVEFVATQDGLRMTMFGLNSNLLCILECIGIVVALNKFIIQDVFKSKIFRLIILLLLILQYLMVFLLASRTGAIILIGVTAVSFLLYQDKQSLKKYFIMIFTITLLAIGLYFFLQSDSMIVNRLLKSVETGDSSGRVYIWLAYLKYFFDSPLIGFGYTGLIDVSQEAGLGVININGMASAFSPHNVFIEILLTTGVVGFVIMIVFFIKTFYSALKGFLVKKDSTYVVYIIPLLVTMLSGQLLTEKSAWIVYAYMISSPSILKKNKR